MLALAVLLAMGQASSPALLESGRAAFERGDYARAEQIYRRYVATNPGSAEGLSNLGAVLARVEKFDEAVAAYERALKLDPKLTPVYFNLAVANLRAGRYEKAIPALERFLLAQPGEPRARQLLGICLVETGDYARGIAQLESLQSDDPSVLFALAGAHIRAGDEARGQALLAKLESLRAYPAQVRLLEALLYYRAERWPEAEQAFEEVLRHDPGSAPALAGLGRLQLRINNDPAAIGYFEKALKLAPQDAVSHYQLGVLLDRSGQAARACEHLKKAIALRANYPDPLYALAKLEFDQKNAPAALALLQQAAKIAPEQESIRLLLARTYQALGRTAEARAEFAQVKRLQEARLERDRKRVGRP